MDVFSFPSRTFQSVYGVAGPGNLRGFVCISRLVLSEEVLIDEWSGSLVVIFAAYSSKNERRICLATANELIFHKTETNYMQSAND